MWIPSKMKLNKFRQVNIPSGRELVGSYGLINFDSLSAGAFSGDDLGVDNSTKIDQIARASSINDYELYKEAMSQQSE